MAKGLNLEKRPFVERFYLQKAPSVGHTTSKVWSKGERRGPPEIPRPKEEKKKSAPEKVAKVEIEVPEKNKAFLPKGVSFLLTTGRRRGGRSCGRGGKRMEVDSRGEGVKGISGGGKFLPLKRCREWSFHCTGKKGGEGPEQPGDPARSK